jgi:hypothetical protein
MQVTVDEFSVGKIRLGEVGLYHGAIRKLCFFVFLLIEDGVIQNTPLKIHFEQKVAGLAKIYAAEFAAFKHYVLEAGVAHAGQQQVAIFETAIHKNKPIQVGISEIAADEFAMFIGLSRGKLFGGDLGESLVFVEGLHGGKDKLISNFWADVENDYL